MTPEGQDAVVQEAYRQAIPAEGRADILVDDGTGDNASGVPSADGT